MPDDQNTTQNPISEENSIPPSPQEPMVDIPVSVMDSTSADIPLEAPESPRNADIPVSLNNPNPENIPVLTETPEVTKPEILPAEGEKVEEIPKPAQTFETGT